MYDKNGEEGKEECFQRAGVGGRGDKSSWCSREPVTEDTFRSITQQIAIRQHRRRPSRYATGHTSTAETEERARGEREIHTPPRISRGKKALVQQIDELKKTDD